MFLTQMQQPSNTESQESISLSSLVELIVVATSGLKFLKSSCFFIQMQQPSNTESLEPISLSSLVELSVVATPGQDQIGEDMKNFAEQLKPYPSLYYFKLCHLLITFANILNPDQDRQNVGPHLFKLFDTLSR